MNVFILVLLLLTILAISFFVNRYQFLSVTFIAASSYLLVSTTYLVGIHGFGKDISIKTVLTICIMLISMLCGEVLGRNIKLKRNNHAVKSYDGYKGCFQVSKSRTFFIFCIMCMTAIYEFSNLYRFSLMNGNDFGISGTVESTRLLVATGKYDTGNLFIVILNIVSELCADIYLYFFLYNLIINKKSEKYLLLPVIGYCFIIVTFTSRTPFIVIFALAITLLIIFSYKNTGIQLSKKNRKIVKKVFVLGTLLLVFFFLYGNITRGLKIGIFEQILSYIGAPLYGLNDFINNPWDKNPIFGFHTLQELHTMLNRLGMDFPIPYTKHLPFFYFESGSSNIYTSLVLPIQDFTLAGAAVVKFLIGWLFGFFFRKIKEISMISKKGIVLTLLLSNLFYCVFNEAIADRYYAIFLKPTTILKYTIGVWIVLRIICKFKIDTQEGKEIQKGKIE